MQANPKPTENARPPSAQTGAELGVADAGSAPAHLSPARALQARLVRELSGPPRRSWLWHSAGLVLAALLSLWIAVPMLNAGL